uniref:Secreted protein n=1 Tax=Arundo donax TaxID=35708 RepID=A0A0A9END4_ARUDO
MFRIDSLLQLIHLLEELALVLAIMENTKSTELYWIHFWHPRRLLIQIEEGLHHPGMVAHQGRPFCLATEVLGIPVTQIAVAT